jgi:5-methylcytosine-specific restriction endonuclease McrA
MSNGGTTKREFNKKRKNAAKRKRREVCGGRAWLELRYQAFKTYGNKCACCGAKPSDGIRLHVDHIKPISKYPELAMCMTNLQILCAACNVGKSNIDATTWRQ